MNAFIASLLLVAAISLTTIAGPIRQLTKRGHPTKLVHFDVGVMVTGSGKLRVNVNKQLGGLVSIQLLDHKGHIYFNQTLYADEELIRLNLDLSHLASDDYVVKISNGLEMITRTVRIGLIKPVEQTRSVTLQ